MEDDNAIDIYKWMFSTGNDDSYYDQMEMESDGILRKVEVDPSLLCRRNSTVRFISLVKLLFSAQFSDIFISSNYRLFLINEFLINDRQLILCKKDTCIYLTVFFFAFIAFILSRFFVFFLSISFS